MELSKIFESAKAEEKWYNYWKEKQFFRSVPDEREAYTVVIPPPNVTGVLHMGHMLNNTLQDVLVRRARMMGFNTCWVPGTDHASIATEAKVVALLKEKGIKKEDLTRDEFLKYAWEWKEKYGGIILKQLEKLGASCDWDRTKFTMEPELSDAVLQVFVDLYKKGKIYRGVRMVNWDPQGLTAVSDEEVIHKEVNSKLVYVKYKIEKETGDRRQEAGEEGIDEYITIATTRPETILGDTAVCVNPDDDRYKHLKGKMAIVPIVNRSVPIIYDEYVDKDFGTGALKVTPAHDINDYNLGIKHKLNVIDTLNANGTLSEAAGHYIGEDRFAVRKKIIVDLEALGLIVKIEDIKNKVGYSERTNAVIEPRLSLQWFLKMGNMSKPALDVVMNGEVKLIPEKFTNTYRHWMENVHDWCISRQLWWGQRIPAWYNDANDFVVCKTADEAKNLFAKKNQSTTGIKQDEDCLDTWFSSWLWPISVFDSKVFETGIPNEELKYYYPTQSLVTAPEILFFWVARMIMAGCEYMNIPGIKNQIPFSHVYLTGIVRDKQGRKMSKSLGNSPDPLDLIAKYGADGVRVGMLYSSPAGNDLLFDESSCEQGRNFANKIWNAYRLINGWEVDDAKVMSLANKTAIEWFKAKMNLTLESLNDCYDKYRISEALMLTYKLIWDDFCALYLEIIKPEFIPARQTVGHTKAGGDGKSLPIDKQTFDGTIEIFEDLLKLLHPFMPFITEELWDNITTRSNCDRVIIAKWPKMHGSNEQLISKMEHATDIISHIRNVRTSKNISPKQKLELHLNATHNNYSEFLDIIIKLGNLSSFSIESKKLSNSYSFIVKQDEFFIPLEGHIDEATEKIRIAKELDYNLGFLKSVQMKLANEKFISNAKPEILANEKRKQADAEAKIKALEAQLLTLSK